MGFLDFIFNSKKFKFDKFVKEEREKFDKDAYDKYWIGYNKLDKKDKDMLK